MLTWFLSNHYILRLVLNASNQEKNRVVSMASLLSSSIRLKFSTHVSFMVLSHSMRSTYEILKIDVRDVITNQLY